MHEAGSYWKIFADSHVVYYYDVESADLNTTKKKSM